MNNTLFILNDPPYGTERSSNGLRLAGALAKRDGQQVRVFLIGVCGSCMDARGLPDGMLGDGCRRSAMDDWADWKLWADRVLVF